MTIDDIIHDTMMRREIMRGPYNIITYRREDTQRTDTMPPRQARHTAGQVISSEPTGWVGAIRSLLLLVGRLFNSIDILKCITSSY